MTCGIYADKIRICDSPYVKDDDKALELFNSTICYENGRYYITWPWKSSEVNLPENFDVAFGRMRSLSRRFQNDRTLFGSTMILSNLKYLVA